MRPLHSLHRVLLVDNNSDDRALALRALRKGLPEVKFREAAEKADWEAELAEGRFDLLITDYEFHWGDGLKVLQQTKARWPDRAVIMYTGTGSEEIAARALGLGLDDYVIKSTDYSRLVHTVRSTLRRLDLEDQQKILADFAVKLAAADSEASLVEITREITRKLFAWDAHYFAVRRPDESTFRVLVYFDTIDGRVKRFSPHGRLEPKPGSPLREILAGRTVVLNRGERDQGANLIRFGDTSRASASLLFAPVRSGETVIGLLSVQSYTPQEYAEEDVSLLERVADTVAPALERIYAEQARLESEQRYRAVVECSPDSIVVTDLDLRIVTANQRACKLHGFDSPDQLIGKNALDLISPEDREQALRNAERAKAEGEVRRLEYWVLRSDEGRVHIELNMTTLTDARGRPTGYVGIGRDLTVRDEARRKLERLRTAQLRQMETLIASLPEGVCLLDGDFRIILANRAANRLLPALTQAKTGQKLTRLGDRSVTELLASQTHERPQDIELPGPPQRVFSVSFHRTSDNGGDDVGWVLVIREVTEERKAKEAEDQQSRLAALGQLAGGVAHHFNNILTSIVGFTQLLLMQDDLPAKAKERLQVIERESLRAAKLVRQILDFGRRSLAHRKPLNLRPVLENIVKRLAGSLPETIHLTLKVDEGEYLVEADAEQIEEILMDLIANARDFMPQGGALSLHLGRLSLTAGQPPPIPGMPPGDWILLTVTDTGPGMPGDVRERVFEPFFTTKDVGEGAGLGLAQVYGIVKQHHGYVGVESRTGEGTTFKLYFPALNEA